MADIFEFRRVCVRKSFKPDRRIENLKRWCRELHGRGLTPPFTGSKIINGQLVQGDGASNGNLSYKTENGIVITCSRLRIKGGLDDSCFALVTNVDLKTKEVHYCGERACSIEAPLHYVLDKGAVFHFHYDAGLPLAERLGIPVTGKRDDEGSLSLALGALVLHIRNPSSRILALKEHGFVVFGTSLDEAGKEAVRFHESCQKCI
jgi:ribulose-5-phosphate 4-epimerase/fuculose-1-phosphate aldolase